VKQYAPPGTPWYKFVEPYYQCDRCNIDLSKHERHSWVMYCLSALAAAYLLTLAFIGKEEVKFHYLTTFIILMSLQTIHGWLFLYYTERKPN
jgi:hypothetical protein